MQQWTPRALLDRAAVTIIALLAFGVPFAPLAATAQSLPPVPIATLACSSGTPGIQVGQTCYAAPALPPKSGQQASGGYQVLVLERATLAPVGGGNTANQSFSTNFSGNPGLSCQAQNNTLADYLNGLSSSSLVIVSSVGDPGYVSPQDCQTAPALETAIESLGGTDGVAVAQTYSLIGIPGLGSGNGWERSTPSLNPTSNLVGYLIPDFNNNYTFLPTAFATVVTRTTDTAGNPAVQVQGATTTAPALPSGALGGFQVVKVDAQILALVSNQTFGTNFGSDISDIVTNCNAQDSMADALAPSSPPVVVIVSSIGNPGDICLYSSRMPEAIQALGGTGLALGGDVNYSLIATPYASGVVAPEASSNLIPGIQAQLTAVLQPNHQSLYTPVASDLSGFGTVNYGLYEIIAQPPSAWPMPATAGQAAAFQYISYLAQDCELPGTPPVPPASFPVCGATDCANVRIQYCNLNFQPDSIATYVQGLVYSDVPAAYQQQFSADDFTAMQTLLAGDQGGGQRGELQYLGSVFTLLKNTTSLIDDLAIGQDCALQSVLSNVLASLALSTSSSNATVDMLSGGQAIVYFGSALAAFGGPGIQAFLGLAAAGLQVGLDAVTLPGGGPATNVEGPVDKLASQLFDQEVGIFSKTLAGVGQLYSIVLTDWNKLYQVGHNVLSAIQGWTWSVEDNSDLLISMKPAFETGFYQSFMPLLADIVFFEDTNPTFYCYCDYQPGACVPIYPYEDVPSEFFSGLGSDYYILDPVHSTQKTLLQNLLNQLYSSPTPSDGGLGVFPGQLLQRIRGWDQLKQVLPVGWPGGCSGVAAPPPALRGKALKVGTGTAQGKISLDGEVPVTAPIDLSKARVFLRQVLTEADAVGELLARGGGAQLLPVELTAGKGSKADHAIFETAPGARPSIRLEVRNRQPKDGQLEVKLTVGQATILAPEGCGEGSALLRTRFIFEDHLGRSLPLNIEQRWQCKKDQLTTP